MFQRTSSAAHMGKSKRDWQTGGPIRREYVHMATTLIGGRARACIYWRGKSNPYFQKGPINVRFCYTRTYRLVLYWFAHLHMCAHMYVCKWRANQCTNFMPGANQNARNPSQKCAWKWFGRIFWGFLEKLIQRVQDDIVVKPSGTEIIKSHRIQIKPTPIWE